MVPTGISTAAVGIYHKEYLGLSSPSLKPVSMNQTYRYMGGSTGVGGNAIQHTVASGYEVITTASPPRFDYAKKLGATYVFDYKSETTVEDIIATLDGKTLAGLISIAEGSVEACFQIASQTQGTGLLHLACL